MAIVSRREAMCVMGLRRPPTLAGLKAAYRTQALLCHPDRCRSAWANERFMRVKDAYDFLLRRVEEPPDEPRPPARREPALHYQHAEGSLLNEFFYPGDECGLMLRQCVLMALGVACLVLVGI